MNKRILIERSGDRTRVAVTNKSDLIEYDESSPLTYRRAKNTIYNATIKSIRPELGAAFVQYQSPQGDNVKDGFLPFANVAPTYLQKPSAGLTENEIGKQIRVGQKILVQIKKDQLHHESKGAALTTFISLAGTYLVLLPLNQKQGISRKADTTQRDNVREIIKTLNVSDDMGIIIRTAGISATQEEIEWDYKALLHQWTLIHDAHKNLSAPCLIHEDENIVTRIIRDNMSNTTEKIICNDQATYEEIKSYLKTIRPDYIDNDILELYDHGLMFEHYSIEDQVEHIFQVRSSLPSGGQVVFHGTEAGYMIDVNSSKSTVGSSVEENAVNTNREAAIKIADMMRLRDISGIIHIDFIDMNEESNRKSIEKVFSDRAAIDRARIKTEPISLLTGCMSILRQGLGTVFFKSSLEPIPNDETIIIGKRRSVASYANYVLSVIEKSAVQTTDIIQVQLPVDVATFLLNEYRSAIYAIEHKQKVVIKILPNEHFTYYRYVLKRFHDDADAQLQQSHQIIEPFNAEKEWIHSTKVQKPHLQHRSTQDHPSQKSSVLGSIWQSIFGSNTETKESTRPHRKSSQSKHGRHRSSSTHPRSRRQDPRGDHDTKRRQDRRHDHSTTRKTRDDTRDQDFTSSNAEPGNQEVKSRANSPTRRRTNSHNRTRKPRTGNVVSKKPIGQFDDD